MREFGHSVSTFKLLTDRFKLTCSSYCLQLITVSIQAEKEHSVLSNLFFLTLPNEVILNFSTSFCFFYLFMFSSFFSKHACVLSRFSRIQLFATLWTMLSMEFATRLLCPWQEYWSGLPCPPPGNLPNPGIEPASLTSPASAGRLFTTSATWEALF